MNALRSNFQRCAANGRLVALLAGCALSGCAGNPFGEAKVDPTSPVAADVARLTRQPARLPTFAAIPKAPTDVRPLWQYGRDARRVQAAGQALTQATAPETWTLQGTDTFADRARQDAGPQIDPPAPGDAEAFARALRERATPPPPR